MTSISSDGSGSADAAAVEAAPYRWAILFLTWFALLICFVDRLAWGNVALDVGRTLGMPVAALGAYVTAFYVGYVVSNAATGFIADRIGSRMALGLGLIALSLCTFAFGFTRSFAAGLAIQALMGLVSGIDYTAGVKLNASWFGALERGRAFGIYMTATSLAVVAANGVVPALTAHLEWSGCYQALGAVTFAVGILSLIAIRNGPADMAIPAKVPFGILFEKRDLLFVGLAGFGALWGTWGFAFWANALMVKGHHLAPAEASSIMVLFGIGAIVSKPVIGLISDWLGGAKRIPIVVVLVTFSIGLLAFGEIESVASFRIFAPLLGLFAFVYSPLTAATVAEIAGPALAASATGVTNAFWQLGNVLVPLAVGAVFQATDSFLAAFVTLAIGPAFGAVMMLFARCR